MRMRVLAAMLVAAAGSAAPGRAAVCDRACLIGTADRVLAGIVAQDLAQATRAASAKFTVNGVAALNGRSPAITGIDGFAYRQYVPDPQTGQIAVIGVAEEDHRRGTFFARLKVSDGAVTEAELIAGPRTEDALPGLISPNPLYNLPLPAASRRSRKELIAIADSYFEGLERNDGSKVPVSEDCRRIEDGVQTSLNPVFMPVTCNDFRPFNYMDKIAGRNYPIVDVDRGLVLGQMVIQVSKPKGPPATSSTRKVNPITGMVMPPNPMRSQPRNTLIQELFKIVDGKIVELQVIRMDVPYGTGDGWRVPPSSSAQP